MTTEISVMYGSEKVKKLYAAFGLWDRDRSQSPPCWKTLISQGKTNTAIHSPHLYGVGTIWAMVLSVYCGDEKTENEILHIHFAIQIDNVIIHLSI